MGDKGNIYIAGPIEGVKNWRLPFNRVAIKLRKDGWFVMSPPEIMARSVRQAMADELTWLATCADAIYMLKGWEYSEGARIEWMLAAKLKLRFFYQDSY